MSFSDQLKKVREDMISDADEYRQAVTISLFNSVILDTPVQTGRLRGNWQTNEKSAKEGTVDREDPSGTTVLSEVEEVVSASKGDTSVHLTNNLPYAFGIEFGHSGQAPQGMVRKNVARIEQILREKNI